MVTSDFEILSLTKNDSYQNGNVVRTLNPTCVQGFIDSVCVEFAIKLLAISTEFPLYKKFLG